MTSANPPHQDATHKLTATASDTSQHTQVPSPSPCRDHATLTKRDITLDGPTSTLSVGGGGPGGGCCTTDQKIALGVGIPSAIGLPALLGWGASKWWQKHKAEKRKQGKQNKTKTKNGAAGSRAMESHVTTGQYGRQEASERGLWLADQHGREAQRASNGRASAVEVPESVYVPRRTELS
jgi:hypothetical protein